MKYENFRPSFMALAGHPRPQLVSTLSALCLNCPTNMRVRTILSAVVIADTIYYAMISVLAIILWFSKNHPLGFQRGMKLSVFELSRKKHDIRAANGPRPLRSSGLPCGWSIAHLSLSMDLFQYSMDLFQYSQCLYLCASFSNEKFDIK